MKYFLYIQSALVCLCVASMAGQSHIVSADDIVNLKQVSAPQISPDGLTVAYTVTVPRPATQHKNAHIWLVNTSGKPNPHAFTEGDAQETDPKWSPDGSSVAFLSDRAGSGLQLWEKRVSNGKERQLTHLPGLISEFHWSPDGRSVAFVLRDQNSKEVKKQRLQKNDQVVADENLLFIRLWLYDIATNEARPLVHFDGSVFEFDWFPNGQTIVARLFVPKLRDPLMTESKMVLLDVKTGKVTRTICESAARNNILRISPDGNRVAFTEEGDRSHFLTIFSLDSGKSVRIGSSYAGTVSGVAWEPGGESLLVEAVEGAHNVIARVSADTGSVENISKIYSQGSSFNLSISRDGTKISYLDCSPHHPAEVAVMENGHSRVLTETNPQVAEWKLGTVQEISWKSSLDGRTIFGVLVLPEDYKKGKAYKTIVQAHGGPEGIWTNGWLGAWNHWAQLFASHGYAVLLPNPRGSDGQGTQFLEANYHDWGRGDFQDVMDGVDDLVKQGIADPEHLGFGGWSYGGYMTYWAITHTSRFKVAVAGAGMPDLLSLSVTTEIQPDYLQRYFGPAKVTRDVLEQYSSIHWLDQSVTPVLILHGQADTRVPTSQSVEFYNGARMAGKQVKMVLYPREGHAFAEQGHQRDLLMRILSWYGSYLN